MSEASGDTTTESDDLERKKKSVILDVSSSLEEKSKEDLIKIVKKQLTLLQKAKGKNDDLTEKCSLLDEKIENYVDKEKLLQNKIEEYENEITNLAIVHENLTKEKDQHISELKESLKKFETEKASSVSLLNEKQEQIECLSMQLQTIKETCHCYQEELTKYQQNNEQMKKDIEISEQKLKDYTNLFNESLELKNKYSICIEENCLLTSKLEELEQQVKSLNIEYNKVLSENAEAKENLSKLSTINQATEIVKGNSNEDLMFLISDNENLTSALNDLKRENDQLKEKLLSSDKNRNNILMEKNITCDGITQNNQDFQTIQKELIELQNHLCDVESTNSKLKYEKETLENENQSILMQIKELNKEKVDAVSKLQVYVEDKLKLEQELKKLSVYVEDNFKMGYEHALLHGAETESFTLPPPLENIQSTNESKSENKLKNNSFSDVSFCVENDYPEMGFEYAFLGGGDVSEVFECSEKSGSKTIESTADQCNNHQDREKLLPSYEKINTDSSVEAEILHLSERLEAYSDLLKEVMEENQSLKQKLNLSNVEKDEPIKLCTLTESSTNTEILENYIDKNIEKVEEYENRILQLQEENSNLRQKNSNLEFQASDSLNEIELLSNEINSLKINVKNSVNEVEELKELKSNLEFNFSNLRNQNSEMCEKLKEKQKKINSFNSDLELLIKYVKEANKQEVDESYNTIADKLPYNLDTLKKLIEKLLSSSATNYNTIKNLSSTLQNLSNEKQEWEEKVNHTEELNKFLEEEVRALQDELEQFKSSPNYYDKFYNTKCLSGSSELYSIEEINEVDDKFSQNDGLLEKEMTCKTSVVPNVDIVFSDELFSNNNRNEFQVQCKDIALQVDLPFSAQLHDTNSFIKKDDVDCETFTEDGERHNLNSVLPVSDNSHFKDFLDSKTIESEVLKEKLNAKDQDLSHLKEIISKLEDKIQNLTFASDSAEKNLNYVKSLAIELKEVKSKLQSDVELLISAFKKEMNTFIYNCNVALQQTFDKAEIVNKKCTYLESMVESFRLYFNNMSDDFKLWVDSLEQFNKNVPINDRIVSLESTFQNHNFDFLSISDIQFENKFSILLKDIESFDFNKQSMFSLLCKYLSTVELSLSNLKMKLNETENKELAKTENDGIKPEDSTSEESFYKSQLNDAETKIKKLKQISLKLKKELCDSKKQCDVSIREKEKYIKELDEVRKESEKISNVQCHYVQNYQTLQSEYDKAQDELELQKEKFKKLQDDFAASLSELNSLKEKIFDTESQLAKSKEVLDATIISKQEAEKMCVDLESKLIISNCRNQENLNKIHELELTVETNQNSIKILTDENNNLKDQLAQSQKEESKKTLLDLEMADYERSVTELNAKLHVKDNEFIELKQKLASEIEKNESLQEEIKSTELLKDTEEKRAMNLKENLEKTKSELMVIKEKEANFIATVSSLQMQLEIIAQQEENYKLQLSESSAEMQHLKEMIKTSSENHQRIVRSLESKISNQKQEIICSHKEVETIKQEFENYKIRVHSVLRQQKSVAPAVVPAEVDLKEKLEVIVEKLKTQVKDMSEKFTALSLEHENLQEEHENLLQRYNKSIEDRARIDSEWHTRLEEINAEKNQLRSAQEELSAQHLLQNEMLVSTYKKQIKIMSDEHKRLVNDLQKQLESSDLEIARLQRDQQKSSGLPVASSTHENSPPFDILSQERQEGEGSECTDDTNTSLRQLSLSTIPTSGFLSFEKLIQSPIDLESPTSLMNYHEYDKLVNALNASNKKIDHLSEVLNESESTNLRMSEQIRVLKEEVRRLERNKEREQHAENLEYLKNVIIKFATLQASAEKAMLIPVLTTMLKLSPSEQQQLKSIAGDGDPNDASNSGWGSYLHRWSGLA